MISFDFKRFWIKFLRASNGSGRIVFNIQLLTVALVMFAVVGTEALHHSHSHRIESKLASILEQEDKVSELLSIMNKVSRRKEDFLLDGRKSSSSARVMISMIRDDLADLSSKFYGEAMLSSQDYLLPSEIDRQFSSSHLAVLRAENIADEVIEQNRTLSYEDGISFLDNYGLRDLGLVYVRLAKLNHDLNMLAIQLDKDLAEAEREHHSLLIISVVLSYLVSVFVSYYIYRGKIIAPLERISSVMKDFPDLNIANNPKEGIAMLEQVIPKVYSSSIGSNEIRRLCGNFASVLTKLIDVCFVLSELSITDPLCSIGNRRALDLYGLRTWNQASRESCSIGIIMLDVDFFKGYNDHYGHDKGDVCLHDLAKCWAQLLLRPLDEVYRFGGEEFLAIVYDPSREKFQQICEEIRSATLKLAIEHPCSEYGFVTVSGGGLLVSNARSIDFEGAYSLADVQLYNSKKSGRNRMSIAYM